MYLNHFLVPLDTGIIKRLLEISAALGGGQLAIMAFQVYTI
jgi:hypothetical protein